MEANNKAMREALEAINCIDTRGLKRLLCELVEADIFDGGQINKTISAIEKARRALSAPPSTSEAPPSTSEAYAEYAKPRLCKSCSHFKADGCEICGCADYDEQMEGATNGSK